MPKDFIKKHLPNPDSVRNNKSLRFLGPLLHQPSLWHLNRHSVIRAFAIGLFWGSIPMPFQMVAAAFFAMRFNANLPLSIGLVWISNPITMPIMFYAEYLLGAWLLNIPPSPFEYELTFKWLSAKIFEIGIPMYFGSVITGIVLAISGYFGVGILWKRSIIKRWNKRKLKQDSA